MFDYYIRSSYHIWQTAKCDLLKFSILTCLGYCIIETSLVIPTTGQIFIARKRKFQESQTQEIFIRLVSPQIKTRRFFHFFSISLNYIIYWKCSVDIATNHIWLDCWANLWDGKNDVDNSYIRMKAEALEADPFRQRVQMGR